MEKFIFSPQKMPKHLENFLTYCWPNVSCHTLYGCISHTVSIFSVSVKKPVLPSNQTTTERIETILHTWRILIIRCLSRFIVLLMQSKICMSFGLAVFRFKTENDHRQTLKARPKLTVSSQYWGCSVLKMNLTFIHHFTFALFQTYEYKF